MTRVQSFISWCLRGFVCALHVVSPRGRWLCVLPRWRMNVNVNSWCLNLFSLEVKNTGNVAKIESRLSFVTLTPSLAPGLVLSRTLSHLVHCRGRKR